MNQQIFETSVVARDVAFAVNHELITNEVPLTIVPTLRIPRAAAPVAPTVNLERKINELEVTAVVATVAVPATSVTEPKLLAPPVVVVATLADKILLPAVTKFKLPVTLTFPEPALRLTAELDVACPIVTDPVVIAVPTATDPVVIPVPKAIVEFVPPVTENA
jgi:hypothetical protein